MSNKSGAAPRINIEKMKGLVEGLRQRPSIDVGVFMDRTARKEEGLTNAAVASFHEHGAPEHGLPKRSVLKEPIKDHAQEIMASVRGKADMLLKASSVKSLWSLVGVACEKIVLQAFDTGGFGKWAPDSYKTLLAKLNRGKFRNLHRRKLTIAHIFAGNTGMGILIDRGELRRAYRSRVRMNWGL